MVVTGHQQAGEAEQELVRSAGQALAAADFAKARALLEELDQPAACDEVLLFSLYLTLRLDALEQQQHSVEDALTMLELLRARLAIHGPWPLHWYIQGWLTAPFVAERRVDPAYLYHLTGELPSVVERQDCLLLATDYGVAYGEHCFLAQLEADYPFDATWLAAPFHRAMVDGLFAAYRRDGAGLRAGMDGLRQTAGTPLERFEAERFNHRFAHFLV